MKTIELSFNEAVELAVKQNIERDQRHGLISDPISEEEKSIYREEAEYILKETGENYQPDFPDHQLIKVKT